jgi:hypothetical protein
MNQGRKCDDCHATWAIHALQKGSFQLAVWDETQLKNRSGVIPVVDAYNLRPHQLNWP